MEKIDFHASLKVGDRICYVVDLDDFNCYRRGVVVAKEIDRWVIIKIDGENLVERVDSAFVIRDAHVKIHELMKSRKRARDAGD